MKHHRSMIALVDEYLAARRALGFALRIEGGQLHAFARYADARRHRGPLTVPVAIAWARSVSPSSPSPGPGGWKSSAASRATALPSTRRLKSRHPGSSGARTGA